MTQDTSSRSDREVLDVRVLGVEVHAHVLGDVRPLLAEHVVRAGGARARRRVRLVRVGRGRGVAGGVPPTPPPIWARCWAAYSSAMYSASCPELPMPWS